jgi:hypothetical protein
MWPAHQYCALSLADGLAEGDGLADSLRDGAGLGEALGPGRPAPCGGVELRHGTLGW